MTDFIDNSTGNTTRIQVNTGESSPTTPVETVKGDSKTYRVGGANGEEAIGVSKYNTASSVTTKAESGSILATAVTPWGSPTSELKDNTIVDVGGIQTSLKVAHQQGLVGKDAQGNYIELNNAPGNTETEAADNSNTGEVVRQLDDNTEQTIGALNDVVGAQNVMAAVAEYAVKGSLSLQDVGKYVDPAGNHSTDDIYAATTSTIQALEGQVMGYLNEVGLTEDHYQGFREFVSSQGQDQYRSTVMQYVTTRDLSSWHNILRSYAEWNSRMLAKYKPSNR